MAESWTGSSPATTLDSRWVLCGGEERACYLIAIKDSAPTKKQNAFMIIDLFGTVLDGPNTPVADGVQRALGRAPRDFSDYVKRTAGSGVWGA